MENNNRRNFLRAGALLGSSMLLKPVSSLATTIENDNHHKDVADAKYRTLGSGKHSIKVSYGMGLGCMGMSFNRSFIPDKKPMIELIRKAYDMGVNLLPMKYWWGKPLRLSGKK
jgi:hypothetical protein